MKIDIKPHDENRIECILCETTLGSFLDVDILRDGLHFNKTLCVDFNI